MIKSSCTLSKRMAGLLTASTDSVAYVGEGNFLVILRKKYLLAKIEDEFLLQLNETILDLKFVEAGGRWRLVVTYASGYAILDESGKQLFVLKSP
jgi:hypothetical protein